MPVINGTWKFRDKLYLPTVTENMHQTIRFTTEAMIEGIKHTLSCAAIIVSDRSMSYQVIDADPKLEDNGDPITLNVYSVEWVDTYGAGIRTLNFGKEGTEVPELFYSLLTANADEVETAPPVSQIFYNNKLLAELSEGQTATILCNEKKFRGNLKITQLPIGGAVDWENIPDVDSIENPTFDSPTVVRCNGELYILVKE